MKTLAACILGFLVGFWAARAIPHEPAHRYKTTHPIALTGVMSGTPLGTLPAGTHVLSPESMESSVDVGWWAYVPVLFGTRADASRFVVPSSEAWNMVGDPLMITASPQLGVNQNLPILGEKNLGRAKPQTEHVEGTPEKRK